MDKKITSLRDAINFLKTIDGQIIETNVEVDHMQNYLECIDM